MADHADEIRDNFQQTYNYGASGKGIFNSAEMITLYDVPRIQREVYSQLQEINLPLVAEYNRISISTRIVNGQEIPSPRDDPAIDQLYRNTRLNDIDQAYDRLLDTFDPRKVEAYAPYDMSLSDALNRRILNQEGFGAEGKSISEEQFLANLHNPQFTGGVQLSENQIQDLLTLRHTRIAEIAKQKTNAAYVQSVEEARPGYIALLQAAREQRAREAEERERAPQKPHVPDVASAQQFFYQSRPAFQEARPVQPVHTTEQPTAQQTPEISVQAAVSRCVKITSIN
jgi:hypothetical protein